MVREVQFLQEVETLLGFLFWEVVLRFQMRSSLQCGAIDVQWELVAAGPPEDFGCYWNISTNVGWIAVTFATNIHGPQTMHFDPLTFHLAPSSVNHRYASGGFASTPAILRPLIRWGKSPHKSLSEKVAYAWLLFDLAVTPLVLNSGLST